jgi:LmbE family N-acetylglucosaminyl deacetylase
MQVVNVAPHPDDELIGAPATLMALRDAGHEILTVACSLGRKRDATRRLAELREACRRAGFSPPQVVSHPLTDQAHAAGSVRDEAERLLAEELRPLLEQRSVGLVVGPSPHDRHPGHEIVGRALLQVLESGSEPVRWWLWGIWGELPFPTTVVEYGDRRLDEVRFALSAHEGELTRNDYRRLVSGRATAATVLAAELVFGFGTPGLDGPYAESTSEVVRHPGGWELGAPRHLDAADPFPAPTNREIGWWLHAPSDVERLN